MKIPNISHIITHDTTKTVIKGAGVAINFLILSVGVKDFFLSSIFPPKGREITEGDTLSFAKTLGKDKMVKLYCIPSPPRSREWDPFFQPTYYGNPFFGPLRLAIPEKILNNPTTSKHAIIRTVTLFENNALALTSASFLIASVATTVLLKREFPLGSWIGGFLIGIMTAISVRNRLNSKADQAVKDFFKDRELTVFQ